MNEQKDKKPNSRRRRGRNPRKDRDEQSNGKKDFSKADLPVGDRHNDPNDYVTDARLAEQASQLSFQQVLGGGPIVGNAEIPTIMSIWFNPAPGVSYSSLGGAPFWVRDGLNMMSAKIYTLLSSYSGRTSTYAPQDVGTMLLAQASMIEAIEHARRAFGVAFNINFRNRAIPKLLIKSMGFNPDDLFTHMADYRMRLNTYIAMLDQIPLLNNIGYIRKSRAMYQNVFTDSVSDMAQMYVYAPESFWILDETSYSGGTILSTVQFRKNGGNLWDFDDYLDQIIDPMVNALLYSSTLNIVYADLLNLASKTKVELFSLDIVEEGYTVQPIYDRNALLQIHNMTIMGAPDATAFTASTTPGVYLTPHNDVYPDASINGLIYNPGWSNRPLNWVGADRLIVDMDTPDPTVVDRIEAMRFQSSRAVGTVNIGTTPYYCFAGLCDHWVTMISLWDGAFNRDWSASEFVLSTPNDFYTVATLAVFDWGPIAYITSNSNVVRIGSDLNFFTTVDDQYTVRLNRLLFTGLFDFR